MKLFLVILLGCVALLLLGGLYGIYRWKRFAASLELSKSAGKAPTMPMIDPDAFRTPDKTP